MQKFELDDMLKGWFVGDFKPTALKTNAVEVGVKVYRENDSEPQHYHKIATELTLILSGFASINGVKFGPGDIILIQPYEDVQFTALTDLTTVVVKVPGKINDKYLGRPNA